MHRPQPAIIVGIGPLGVSLCKTLLARQNIREAFDVKIGGAHLTAPYSDDEIDSSALLTVLTMPAIHLEQTLWGVTGTATEIREQFLNEGILPATRLLTHAFDRARTHTIQPMAEQVRPTFYIVGATCDPVGSALLWMIPALVRSFLHGTVSYNVSGVFVAAHVDSHIDEQQFGDALTFVTLTEGDTLLTDRTHPAWFTQIEQGRADVEPAHLFDQLYLIDSLKGNNATVEAEDDPIQLLSHLATFIESMVYSPIEHDVDQLLQDDYRAIKQQRYIGVGSSALVVPLEQIALIIEEHTLGVLIESHLLPNRERLQEGAQAVAPVVNQIIETIHDTLYEDSEREARSQAQRGTVLPLGGKLHFHFTFDKNDKEGFPTVEQVKLKGSDPFANTASFANTTAILQDEVRARTDLIRTMQRNLEQSIPLAVNLAVGRSAQSVGQQLRQGEGGLSVATELLRGVDQELRVKVKALTHAENELRSGDKYQKAVQAVEGAERLRFIERLQGAIQARPHLSALALRLFVLFVLLFQFYFDGLIREQQLYPFGQLDIWPFSPLNAGGEWDLALRLLLFVLLIALILAGWPWLASQYALWSHRRALTHLIRLEAQIEMIRAVYKAVENTADAIRAQYQILGGEMATLRRTAQKYLSEERTRLAQPNIGYLQHAVVDPYVLLPSLRQAIAYRTLERENQRLVESWASTSIAAHQGLQAWRVRRADEVIARIRKRIKPTLEEKIEASIEGYLTAKSAPMWASRLWASASPWIKADSTGDTRWGNSTPIEGNFLLISFPHHSSLVKDVQKLAHQCTVVGWEDAHRIILLRMLCGVQTDQLARYSQMRLAFQSQPERIRSTMTDSQGVLVRFPSLATDEGQAEEDSKRTIRSTIQEIGRLLTALLGDIDGVPGESATEFARAVREVRGEYTKLRQGMMALERFISKLGDMNRALEVLEGDAKLIVRPVMDEFDGVLAQNGIVVVRPKLDSSYNPERDGRKVGVEAVWNSNQENTIVRVVSRGYSRRTDNVLLVVPEVIVGKSPEAIWEENDTSAYIAL